MYKRIAAAVNISAWTTGSANLANGLTAGETIGMILVGSILAGMISFICGEPGVSLASGTFDMSSLMDPSGPISCWLPNDESSSLRHVRLLLCCDAKMLRQLYLVGEFRYPQYDPADAKQFRHSSLLGRFSHESTALMYLPFFPEYGKHPPRISRDYDKSACRFHHLHHYLHSTNADPSLEIA